MTVSRLHGSTVSVPAARALDRFYRHGWQSWSETRWLDPSEEPVAALVPERRPFVDDPAYAGRAVHGGSAVGAVRDRDGGVTLLGALDLGGRVEVHDGELVGTFEDGPGSWFAAEGDERGVFDAYAAALGERFGRRPRDRRFTMWSSWYSFYADISETLLHAVLDDVAGLGFQTFQVDDGWQRAVGDWQPNDRFPAGLADLAGRIGDHGHRPGLWLAPFIARRDSDLFHDRPELFVVDDDGAPVFAGNNWGGPCHALDVTHPGAEELVADVLSSVVGAGFTCLKLDFLCAAALPGRRHDDDVGREPAYRRAVELVRSVVGDDVYLLGCGAPVIASLGVFDGIRVGPDVAPWWEVRDVTRYLHDVTGPNARYALATSLHRLWLGDLVDTDPDVAYFRTRYSLLTREHRRDLQDLARVAGFRATSDPPAWLDPDERAELVAFLRDDPRVEPLGRHRYRVDGRDVDFGPIAEEPPGYARWTAS